jgi:hypothetical protein
MPRSARGSSRPVSDHDHGRDQTSAIGRERQLEGIVAARAHGVSKSRKPVLNAAGVHRLEHQEKLGAAAVARLLRRPTQTTLLHARPPAIFVGRF